MTLDQWCAKFVPWLRFQYSAARADAGPLVAIKAEASARFYADNPKAWCLVELTKARDQQVADLVCAGWARNGLTPRVTRRTVSTPFGEALIWAKPVLRWDATREVV
jgi:hypothetical protein